MSNICFTKRDDFYIYGGSVETTLADSGKDIGDLIAKLAFDRQAECYGLMWYTEGHERYRYLLGKEADIREALSPNYERKRIPKAMYAVSPFPQGYDNTKAWTDFFFTDVPAAGYSPDFEHGFFFEYYPEGLNGRFELWTPVVQAREG